MADMEGSDPLRDLIAEVDGIERRWREMAARSAGCPVVIDGTRCGERRGRGKSTCSRHDPDGDYCQANPEIRSLVLSSLAENAKRVATEPIPRVRPRGSPTFVAKVEARCWMCGGAIPAGKSMARFSVGQEGWIGHPSCVDAALRAAANRYEK